MSLNCNEIEAVLSSVPQNGIVRGYGQPDDRSLSITYQPSEEHIYTLTVSVYNDCNHIYALPTDNVTDKHQGNFSRYLNSNCRFASVVGVTQYRLSRIVDIALRSSDSVMHILCRMWNSGGNIILTDSDYKITECLHRYPKRSEWPGEVFDLSSISVGRTDYPIREEFCSTDINQSVRRYFDNRIIGLKADRLRHYITEAAAAASDNLTRTLASLDKADEGGEQYLRFGELIKSNAHSIYDYCKEAAVYDYAAEAEILIPMNETMTAAQNMQYYFDKYRRAKEAALIAADRAVSVRLKLESVNDILNQAQNTDRLKTLSQLSDRLDSLIGRHVKSQTGQTFGRKFILADNTVAYVSKNAKDADQLLKRIAKGNDYWFHIRDYAGSHVIVKNNKSGVLNPTAKIQAAHLALYYSQLRTDSNLNAIADGDVYFTQIKYLRKPNLNTPGLVFPTQEKNIKVRFDKQIIMQVLANRQ